MTYVLEVPCARSCPAAACPTRASTTASTRWACTLAEQRDGPPLDERALSVGSLERLRAGWPAQYREWSRLV